MSRTPKRVKDDVVAGKVSFQANAQAAGATIPTRPNVLRFEDVNNIWFFLPLRAVQQAGEAGPILRL
jgi:hypothetical protein